MISRWQREVYGLYLTISLELANAQYNLSRVGVITFPVLNFDLCIDDCIS